MSSQPYPAASAVLACLVDAIRAPGSGKVTQVRQWQSALSGFIVLIERRLQAVQAAA
jgi:hypothetical protein